MAFEGAPGRPEGDRAAGLPLPHLPGRAAGGGVAGRRRRRRRHGEALLGERGRGGDALPGRQPGSGRARLRGSPPIPLVPADPRPHLSLQVRTFASGDVKLIHKSDGRVESR